MYSVLTLHNLSSMKLRQCIKYTSKLANENN